jgi:hypothetical protein
MDGMTTVPSASRPRGPHHIGIRLFDGVEELTRSALGGARLVDPVVPRGRYTASTFDRRHRCDR